MRSSVIGTVVDPLRDLASSLQSESAFRVKIVRDVQLSATTSRQEFSHGLGVPYVGAACIGITPAIPCTVEHPASCTDATKRVTVQLLVAQECLANFIVYY